MLFDVFAFGILMLTLIKRTGVVSDVVIGIVLIVVVAVMNKLGNIPNILGLKGAIGYLCPFYWSIICVKYHLPQKMLNLSSLKFWMIFVIIATLTMFIMTIESIPLGSFYSHLPGYFLLLLLYCATTKLFAYSNLSAFVQSVDRNSLGIYILHNFVGKYTLWHFCPAFVVFYDKQCVVAPLFLFVFMFLMAWMVSRLLHKNKYAAMLIGG